MQLEEGGGHDEGDAAGKQAYQRCVWALDGLAENIAFFEEEGFGDQALCYLAAKVRCCLTDIYAMAIDAPSLTACADKLESIVESCSACAPLKDVPAYKAFAGHHVLLPVVAELPVEQKLQGAFDWIDFVAANPPLDSSCVDECADAMANAVRGLAGAQGKSGLAGAYTQLVKRTDALPLNSKVALLAKFHRHLASRQNVRSAFGRVKRKVLGATSLFRRYLGLAQDCPERPKRERSAHRGSAEDSRFSS